MQKHHSSTPSRSRKNIYCNFKVYISRWESGSKKKHTRKKCEEELLEAVRVPQLVLSSKAIQREMLFGTSNNATHLMKYLSYDADYHEIL